MGVRKSISQSEFSENDEIDDEDYAGSLSEEEPEDHSVAGTSRLSHYKKPKISQKKSRSRYKIQKNDSPKDKGKAPAKGRNFGKLSQLKNMSLDILFELSRVSKQFRSLFASKGSRHIWAEAKRNLATEMPECPADLSEPQYISLMFEHNCQACGKNRAPKTDYALRVRFCGHCFDENVLKGTKILKNLPNVSDTVFQLVPRSRLKLSNRSFLSHAFDSTENGRNNAYYFPEIESVVERYKELESDATALATFVQEHKETASQMMKARDANILTQWAEDHKANKVQEDTRRMKNRRASIEKKLEELGWDRKDFPKTRNYEWSKLLDQPRELTPRIRKEETAKEELRERSVLRRTEFKSIWEKYSMKVGEQGRPSIMPHYLDAAEFGSIKNVLYENEAREPFTQSRWDTLIDCLPDEISTFRTRVINTLAKRLEANKPASPSWEKPFILQSPDPEEAAEHDILERASSLFRCYHYSCKKIFHGVTGILEHTHFNNLAWSNICGRLSGNSNSKAAVQMILKTLQLPEGSTFEAVCVYDGKLVCLCGHPKHREPKTFLELVLSIIAMGASADPRVFLARSTI
ncbi:hypothetical protein HWV62_20822 [Athelia sp. TMB]|nr:hypothetical protein HWV62_20822 [Athelia sp. TMB]